MAFDFQCDDFCTTWLALWTIYVYYTFRLFLLSQCFWWQGTFLLSQLLLSQLFADEARYCRVSFFADKATWFSAETYYIRILNVLPVFAESMFLMTRHVFAESAFCWVRWVFAESVFVESVICWRGALLPNQFCWVSFFSTWFSAETYYIRIIKVSPILLSQFLLSHQLFAESGAFLPSQFFADKATWFSAETYYLRYIHDILFVRYVCHGWDFKRCIFLQLNIRRCPHDVNIMPSLSKMTTALVSETPRLYVHAVNHLASHILKLLTTKPDFLVQELHLTIGHLESVQATLLLGNWQATTTIISYVENNHASFSCTPRHLTVRLVAVRWWHWCVHHVDIWVVYCRLLVFLFRMFSTTPCYKLSRVLTRANLMSTSLLWCIGLTVWTESLYWDVLDRVYIDVLNWDIIMCLLYWIECIEMYWIDCMDWVLILRLLDWDIIMCLLYWIDCIEMYWIETL